LESISSKFLLIKQLSLLIFYNKRRDDIVLQAQHTVREFELEDFISIESMDAFDLSVEYFEKNEINLLYTSAAAGVLFDVQMLHLALKCNVGLVLNSLAVSNLKEMCHGVKEITSKVAAGEIYKTGKLTDADLSTEENLQKRDIFYIDIPSLKKDELECMNENLLSSIEQFDKLQRSTKKTINHTWFTNIFQQVQKQIMTSSEFTAIDITKMLESTFWGNFLFADYTIKVTTIEAVAKVISKKYDNAKLWNQAKELLCALIVEELGLISSSITELFPDMSSLEEDAIENQDFLVQDHDDQDAVEEQRIDNVDKMVEMIPDADLCTLPFNADVSAILSSSQQSDNFNENIPHDASRYDDLYI